MHAYEIQIYPGKEGTLGCLLKLLIYSLALQLWGLLLNLIGWFIAFSISKFQPLIVIYRMGNYMNHHWVCTLIYQPLSYSFKSLNLFIYLSISTFISAMGPVWIDLKVLTTSGFQSSLSCCMAYWRSKLDLWAKKWI